MARGRDRIRLSFHGAAGQVTGSCHLLEHAGLKILIDCGIFQGSRSAEEENAGDFGFVPRDIDILLLTHAHLDHCGRIPLLVKRGFRGEIIATAATRELARLALLDSAHIQEEDARREARRHAARLPRHFHRCRGCCQSDANCSPLDIAIARRCVVLSHDGLPLG